MLTRQNCRSRITEYGRVVTDDTRKCRDKRWYRTISTMFCHMDGNPAHPMNGGITGLASEHCLASLANHSLRANAEYDVILNTATPRAFLELTQGGHGAWSCIVLKASEDIFPDQQILCDYEPKTAAKMWIVLGNETIFKFVQCFAAVIRGKGKWFGSGRKCHF